MDILSFHHPKKEKQTKPTYETKVHTRSFIHKKVQRF
jgi:hypothetical protein